MKSVEVKVASVTREAPNLLTIKYKELEEEPETDDVQEFIDTVIELSEGKKMGILIDIRDILMDWSNESKEHLSQSEAMYDLRIANAVLVNNLPVRILVHTYLKFKKPPGEFKVFRNEEKARVWLQEKIDKYYA